MVSSFALKVLKSRGFNDEAVALSRDIPDEFMRVSVDLTLRCIVMKDYGSSLPDDGDLATSKPELFRNILSTWARIQIKSVAKRQDLLQTDLPVIEVAGLKFKIQEMFADQDWWVAQLEGMTESEESTYDEVTYKQMYLAHVEEPKDFRISRLPLYMVT